MSTTHFEYIDLCLISEMRSLSEVAAAATLRATLPRTLLRGGKIISKENCKKVRPSNKEKNEIETGKGNRSERKGDPEGSVQKRKMKRERRLFTTECKRRKEKKPKTNVQHFLVETKL
jgi:hypothetical protein